MGTQCTEGGIGCKPGLFCAVHVCTAKFASNSNCPDGRTCGDLEEKHTLGPSEIEVGQDVIQACLPPPGHGDGGAGVIIDEHRARTCRENFDLESTGLPIVKLLRRP